MKVSTLVAPAALAAQAHAFFRMQCHSRLSLDQVDPIVNPGVVPSTHIHSIMGGNNFHPTCNGNKLKESTCTSCRVKGDGSAYWVPALYFENSDTGKFELVRQVADMLVYYLPEREREKNMQTLAGLKFGDKKYVNMFPENFRMLAGDPKIRSFPAKVEATEEYRRQRAIGFNCMNYSAKPIGFLEVNEFPDRETLKTCKDGLRAEIAFPNCWDGKNHDSEDHRSHVAYPMGVQGGDCPSTHPHRIISILYETTWAVAEFNNKNGRFVWSHADPTGYGYHGDFMAGWEDGLLERVQKDESCCQETMYGGQIEKCELFQNEKRLRTDQEMASCTIEPFAKGNFSEPMKSLPGCPSIESGPDYAKGCVAGGGEHPTSYGSMSPKPTGGSDNGGDYNNGPDSGDASGNSPPAPAPPAPAPPANAPNYNAKQAVQAPAQAPAPPAQPAPPAGSKCGPKKDNVVMMTQTVTETKHSYAKRSPAPHVHHHRRRHNNRRH